MLMSELPKEALVDADFLAYRIGFATVGEDQQAARARLKEWLDNLLYQTLNIEDYQLFLTGKGNFRDTIAVTQPYKGNREGFVRPEHYQYLRDIMINDYGASVSEGQEADDDVAIESCRGSYLIVGVDKDLLQLPGHHYNPVKNEFCYVSEYDGLFNFYTQLLTGDRADNIPGLHKVGKVTAAKILAKADTEEKLAQAVWKAYKERKHGIDYYTEQGQLLWLRREPNEIWKPHETVINSGGTKESSSL